MNTQMLSEVIVTTETLVTIRVWAGVRCIGIIYKYVCQEESERDNSRFSCVCILLICRFKCSPLAKHFPHPTISQTKVLGFLHSPSFLSRLELPFRWLSPDRRESTVGTLRPRDFFVKLGTGIGSRFACRPILVFGSGIVEEPVKTGE